MKKKKRFQSGGIYISSKSQVEIHYLSNENDIREINIFYYKT